MVWVTHPLWNKKWIRVVALIMTIIELWNTGNNGIPENGSVLLPNWPSQPYFSVFFRFMNKEMDIANLSTDNIF